MSSFWDRPGAHNQYFASFFASLGALCLGATVGWSAPAQHHIMQNAHYGFPVNLDNYAWICALLALGSTCAALFTGPLANCLGRKPAMLLAVPPFLAGWVLIIYANNLQQLMLARFVQGLCGGCYVITVPMYCMEIAQEEVRRALGTFFGLFFVLGVLYAYIAGAFNSFQVLNYSCAILPIIFLVTFVWMPETPIYFLSKNLPEKAQKSIRWLRGPLIDAKSETSQILAKMARLHEQDSSFKQTIKRKATLKALLICIGLAFFQHMCGSTAIITYVTFIVHEANAGIGHPPEISTIAVGICFCVAVFVSHLALDCAGRRSMLTFSMFVILLNDALLAAYFQLKDRKEDFFHSFKWLPLCSLCCHVSFYGLGLGTVPFYMWTELFPENFTNSAICIICTMSALFAFITTKCFPLTCEAWGMADAFWLLSGISLLAIIFIYFVVPETQGKTLAEVREMLK